MAGFLSFSLGVECSLSAGLADVRAAATRQLRPLEPPVPPPVTVGRSDDAGALVEFAQPMEQQGTARGPQRS